MVLEQHARISGLFKPAQTTVNVEPVAVISVEELNAKLERLKQEREIVRRAMDIPALGAVQGATVSRLRRHLDDSATQSPHVESRARCSGR